MMLYDCYWNCSQNEAKANARLAVTVDCLFEHLRYIFFHISTAPYVQTAVIVATCGGRRSEMEYGCGHYGDFYKAGPSDLRKIVT